jgi:hypothetical protein
MSHDPLCWPVADGECHCDLIAAVRERTLDEAIDALEATDLCGFHGCRGKATSVVDGLRQVTP